mgnify:CR=1 FL=1
MVKLRINGSFDIKNTGRDVLSKKPGGGSKRPVPEPALNLNSTTYDLKLDKTVWDSTGRLVAQSRQLALVGQRPDKPATSD